MKTLVLDLDETLVHSSTTHIHKYDFRFAVTTRSQTPQSLEVFVRVRPFIKEFLRFASKYYEVVVFTASLREVKKADQYANPLLDRLDANRFIDYRLFREHCTLVDGSYTKDLSLLGRDLKDVILMDVDAIDKNSTLSFKINPENGLLVRSFFSDSRDKELIRLMPLLIFLAEVRLFKQVYDVREVQDWATTFSEDQFIAFINNKEQENVINKSDYLRDIIGYLKTTYFDDILGAKKRKSFSLKKSKDVDREEEQDAGLE